MWPLYAVSLNPEPLHLSHAQWCDRNALFVSPASSCRFGDWLRNISNVKHFDQRIWPNYNIIQYFTNLDFPEIRGPISLLKRYLLGEIRRVRSRAKLPRKDATCHKLKCSSTRQTRDVTWWFKDQAGSVSDLRHILFKKWRYKTRRSIPLLGWVHTNHSNRSE